MSRLFFGSLLGLCGLVMQANQVSAEDSEPNLPSRNAIQRALTFLKDDAAKWKVDHECATCHHGIFTVWTLAEARRRGFAVDAEAYADVVKWAKQKMDRVDLPRDTRPGWSMVNTPLIYLALMSRWNPQQDILSDEERQKIYGHLLRHQETDGSWAWSSAPAKNRPPPFFESDEVATRLALLALPDAAPSESAEIRASREKAKAWLDQIEPSPTTQAAALRLLWKSQTDPSSVPPVLDRFLALQRDDGGFAQLADRPSDAYATGQALYVLSLAKAPADRPELRRAIDFLVSTQREDGSWPMTRRGHEGVTPSDNLVPITYFGTAWAALGLLRSSPN